MPEIKRRQRKEREQPSVGPVPASYAEAVTGTATAHTPEDVVPPPQPKTEPGDSMDDREDDTSAREPVILRRSVVQAAHPSVHWWLGDAADGPRIHLDPRARARPTGPVLPEATKAALSQDVVSMAPAFPSVPLDDALMQLQHWIRNFHQSIRQKTKICMVLCNKPGARL